MDERASLFPEGLAGARQGMVASYLRRGVGHKLQVPPGSSTEMVHRDDRPSPLLLMQRESSKAVINALDAFASGQDWGEASPTSQAAEVVDDGAATSSDSDETGDVPDDGELEGQHGISQLASKNAVYEAESKRLGDQVPRRARRWRTLNVGKKWDKAQALAESKRKPLKPNRRVRIRPQQVQCVTGKDEGCFVLVDMFAT